MSLYTLALTILLLIPPTPTPRPPAVAAPITIDSASYDMWTFADESVGFWNDIGGDKTQIVQIIVIAVLVFFSFVIIVASLRGSGSEDKAPPK